MSYKINNWISVKEALPAIPENQYSVSVLVCEYDPLFEEISHGKGLSVNKFVSYGKYKEYDNELEFFGFHEMVDDGWISCIDIITHWMYLPEPPKYKTKLNDKNGLLDFVYVEDNYETKIKN